jgi:hypothetical protein
LPGFFCFEASDPAGMPFKLYSAPNALAQADPAKNAGLTTAY